MKTRLHSIVETPEFRRIIAGLLDQEGYEALIGFLAANPAAGDLAAEYARNVKRNVEGRRKHH